MSAGFVTDVLTGGQVQYTQVFAVLTDIICSPAMTRGGKEEESEGAERTRERQKRGQEGRVKGGDGEGDNSGSVA